MKLQAGRPSDQPEDTPPNQPNATEPDQNAQSGASLRRSRQWGRIEVLPEVVGAVAAHAALDCYGVHGMAARGLRDGFAELLRRDNLHRGVEVREDAQGLHIDVYVVVQFGIRITEVAHNLQAAVRFEVERTVAVPVAEVAVNVQGVYEP